MQNEINLKEFEFDEKLLANVTLFDEVLADCGEPPLFENENFSHLFDFTISSRYLVLELNSSKQNALPLIIWFEADDLRIDIDGISETFEWAKQHIDQDRDSVMQLIKNLFTGFVLIDERGSSKFIQIFDANGDFVSCRSRNNWLHMITGRFMFRFKDYRKLDLSLFKKNNFYVFINSFSIKTARDDQCFKINL